MSRNLRLVPIFCGSAIPLLGPLESVLAKVFRMEITTHPPAFDPEEAYDAGRGQYDSRLLLVRLLENLPDDVHRVLGVVGVDLFIPVLTFVFGEAQLGGRGAIVSLHRLRPELYGLPQNENLLFRRLCKEAVHEIGHTFSLLHCIDPSCVMVSSTYVEQIDLKSDRFCGDCASQLRPRIDGADPSEPADGLGSARAR